MGMTKLQVLWYIDLPQMLRFSVPGMVNEFTSVLKYSPFAYTVGIPEITKQAIALTSTTLRGVEVYLAVGILYLLVYIPLTKENPVLKEYKDGIQNHLTWNIKGECFFVRPNDDVTVYLIRVQDCDKK